MSAKLKNRLLAVFYALILGVIVGLFTWAFLRLTHLSIEFIWGFLPSQFNFPFFTLVICVVGGLIIGIWREHAGDYPKELEEVISTIKTTGKYPYKQLPKRIVSAFLPLIFGGSVGPEAGLAGIIASFCYWISDKFKTISKKLHDLTKLGLSASLGVIFNAPMYGFVVPFESQDEKLNIPKISKTIFYILTIIGAFVAFIILGQLFGQNEGLFSLPNFEIGLAEWLWLLPLLVIGIAAGLVYNFSRRVTKNCAKPFKNQPILSCMIAGALLGTIGSFLPFVMFSGESQIAIVSSDWQQIGALILIITGIIKIIVTNFCISFGVKGGHFYPLIFSGISLGYGIAILSGINPVFSACIITTALMTFVMQKPIAAVLLLLLCFSPMSIPIMLLVAIICHLLHKKWS